MTATLTAEEAPDKVQEYTAEGYDDGIFAFICPRCSYKNKLKGNPRKYANKPFNCVDCGYVPLLGKEGIEEFAEEIEVKGNETDAEGGN